jgi:hypothetical protein
MEILKSEIDVEIDYKDIEEEIYNNIDSDKLNIQQIKECFIGREEFVNIANMLFFGGNNDN